MIKVIHFDFDKDSFDLLRSVLDDNFEYFHTCNVYDLINLFQKNKPDIFICEINYIDSETIYKLKKINPDCSFVVYSFLSRLCDKLKAINLGFQDYLVKPCNKEELLNRINQNKECKD